MSLPAAPAKLPLSKIRPKLQQAVLKTSHIFFRISLTLESGPLDLDIEPIWHICVRQAQLADPRQSKTPAHFGGVNSCPCSLLLNGASGGQESNLHTPETANKPNILSTVLKTGEGDTHIYVFTCVYACLRHHWVKAEWPTELTVFFHQKHRPEKPAVATSLDRSSRATQGECSSSAPHRQPTLQTTRGNNPREVEWPISSVPLQGPNVQVSRPLLGRISPSRRSVVDRDHLELLKPSVFCFWVSSETHLMRPSSVRHNSSGQTTIGYPNREAPDGSTGRKQIKPKSIGWRSPLKETHTRESDRSALQKTSQTYWVNPPNECKLLWFRLTSRWQPFGGPEAAFGMMSKYTSSEFLM